jgi:hypothetical protein
MAMRIKATIAIRLPSNCAGYEYQPQPSFIPSQTDNVASMLDIFFITKSSLLVVIRSSRIMRFLERNDRSELSLAKDFGDNDIPRYAILSHT